MIGKDVVVGRSGNFPYFRTVRGVLERIDAWSDFVIQWVNSTTMNIFSANFR